MTNWYVQKPNPEFEQDFIGPLRPSELLKLVRDGEVGPEHLLRKDNSAWFEAREVGGLFEAAMRPTIRYFCPKCNVRIPEVPITCPKCGSEVTKARREIIENTIVNLDDPKVATPTGQSVQKWLRKRVRKKESDDES